MKNKRITLLLAGCCLFALTALAQPSIGLKAGANYSGISGYDGSRRLNLHAGIYVNVNLSKHWSLQPELLYSGEGQHYTMSSGDVEDHTTSTKGLITLDYATLPIMFRFATKSRFYVEAGPQLSVLIAAHSKGLGTDNMNVKRSFSNGQFGLNLGAGVSLNQRLSIYSRYNFGMTDITRNSGASNKTGTAQLGIQFMLKKAAKPSEQPVH